MKFEITIEADEKDFAFAVDAESEPTKYDYHWLKFDQRLTDDELYKKALEIRNNQLGENNGNRRTSPPVGG